MKKKIVFLTITIVAIAIGFVFFWPLSFSGVIADDTDLNMIRIDTYIDDGTPKSTHKEYQLHPGSEELEQIQQILNKYSFHRSIRTFLGDASLNGTDAGYWLHLYSGENQIISGGTGEIIVNDRVYRIGYWGNKAALSLMEEIMKVIQ